MAKDDATPQRLYLVAMSDGTRTLIDSGTPPDIPLVPGMPPAEDAQDVIAHLAALGLRPEAIDRVICTHFDSDHVGHHAAFPQAEFIVQREQYERARGGDARFAAGRARWGHPALRYRLVDGDTAIAPGLTLIETSGHAPGHQSMLVRLPQTGPVLLAADAVVMQRLFTPDRAA